jgi:hypothetical protein
MVDIKTEVRLIIKLYLAHGGSLPSQNKAAWKSWAPYLRPGGWSGRAIIAHENMVNNNLRQLSDMVSSKFDSVIHCIGDTNKQNQVERKEILGMYTTKCDTHESKIDSIESKYESKMQAMKEEYEGKMKAMKEEYEGKMQVYEGKMQVIKKEYQLIINNHNIETRTLQDKHEGKINKIEDKYENKMRALEDSNKDMYQHKVDNGVLVSKVANQSKELKRAIAGNEAYKRDNAVKCADISTLTKIRKHNEAAIKRISSANEVLTKKLQIKMEELKYATDGSSNNSSTRVIKIKRARNGYATRSHRIYHQ